MCAKTLLPLIKHLQKTEYMYTVKNEDTAEERQHQMISTRPFLVLFVISLIDLIGHEGLTLTLTSVQITHSSQSAFQKRHLLHSQALGCSCLQTPIRIDKFAYSIVLKFSHFPVYICSNMFVND